MVVSPAGGVCDRVPSVSYTAWPAGPHLSAGGGQGRDHLLSQAVLGKTWGWTGMRKSFILGDFFITE